MKNSKLLCGTWMYDPEKVRDYACVDSAELPDRLPQKKCQLFLPISFPAVPVIIAGFLFMAYTRY